MSVGVLLVYVAIGAIIGGLALLTVPKLWRVGAALFAAGLILAPVGVVTAR